MSYLQQYNQSIQHPEEFWKLQSQEIDWFTKPTNILSSDIHNYPRWFEDGQLNMSYLCVDKHVDDGYGDQVAIIYDSPVTNSKEHITFAKLHEEVSKLAGGLQTLGLQKGDTVIVYMPMIPQAIYAMLACARLGVTHSVVFGGFAPHELAIRIDDCNPKAIITASSGIEIKKIIPYKPYVDKAIEQSQHKPEHVIVFDRGLGASCVLNEIDIDEREALNLILTPGFSTAGEVSQVSGRGVGMDVVASELKQLGGSLQIDSVHGEGALFTIHIPFTLAITQSLLIKCANEIYAIPLVSVEGVVRLSSQELKQKYAEKAATYHYADRSYRLCHLGSVLGVNQPQLGGADKMFPVLLVRSGDSRMALHVEATLGNREIVVKPLCWCLGR